MSYFTLCVEGTKGAGKTTTIEKLAQRLTQSGFDVERCAPFAAANDFAKARGFTGAVQMIGASKRDNRDEIDFILSTIAQARERAARKAETGTAQVVLIVDRGWMTILPHLFGGRWHAEDRADSGEIRAIWNQVLAEAPATVFLHASYEVTKKRCANIAATSGLDTDEKLRGDVEERVAFAKAHGDKIVLSFDTGEIPQDRVVSDIADYVRRSCAGEQPAP
jgi:thymidylate kinase